MARTTAASDGNPNGLEEDVPYSGVLLSAKVAKSKKEGYPDQIEVDWELKQGAKQRDWLGISLGISKATGLPSKLRQALNAMAEHAKDADLWFDPETLEWGYDMEKNDSPAYAKLAPGMAVAFKGLIVDGRYKITRYSALDGGSKRQRKTVPVDVDPDDIPF